MPTTNADHAPSALLEPMAPVGKRFVTTYSLSYLGLWMALLAPIQVLLAQQMEVIAPANKEVALGWVTGAGALFSMISNPLFGALSDRTTSRFGRRRPWNFAGAATGAIALVMLGQQDSLLGVGLWWCVAQFALNAMLAALTAELPDQVPVSQRAVCGAWVGIMQPLGVVVGTALVTMLVHGIAVGYAVLAIVLMALALPFVTLIGNTVLRPQDRAAWSWREFLSGFWIDPKAHPDFAWSWIMRFFVQLGSAMSTLFLLYYLRDEIHFEQRFPGRTSEDGLMVLVLIYTVGIIVGAMISGAVSDRSGKRRRNVTVSCAIMAVASLLLALWPTWWIVTAGAAVLGLGYGAYISVEQALMSQVLPTAGEHGKDLGILNMANAAPQVLGPAVSALLVTQLGGYSTLYLVTSLLMLLGGGLVWKVHGVP